MLTRALLVEDQPAVAAAVRVLLMQCGFEVRVLERGEPAVGTCREFLPDLVLLDLDLPGISGFEVCRLVREHFSESVPVLVLSARAELRDKVEAFQSGADDYLCKPFEAVELQARIHSLLGRTERPTRAGGLIFDRFRQQVQFRQKTISLTSTEYELLRFLVSRVNEPLSRELLLERIWGPDYSGSGRTLDFHVARLRQKLGPSSIRTVRGLGYLFHHSG